MVNISKQDGTARSARPARERDWRRAMSDHVAWGLLAYTAVTIFVTIKALEDGSSSLLPYAALIVLVAGIIPACRWFEKRWTVLGDEAARDPALAGAFRRDTLGLWVLAIGLPVGLAALFRLILGTA